MMGDDETQIVHLQGPIPQRNEFHRSKPAGLEGPAGAWEVSRTLVDLGAAFLNELRTISDERRIRDLVLIALLRRALVTGEGFRALLWHGLLEPAQGTFRTLLDIEMSVRLILGDPSDRMAKRLGAYHYLTYRKHGQDLLHNPTTRTDTLAKAGRIPEVIEVAKSYARLLESPVFDEIRADLDKGGHWHGYSNVEAAFRAAGMETEYHMSYDSATWFVHSVNVEFDYTDVQGSTTTLRSLVERDPKVIQLHLGLGMLRLHALIGLLVDTLGMPKAWEAFDPCVARFPDGSEVEVGPFKLVGHQLMEAFGGSPDE